MNVSSLCSICGRIANFSCSVCGKPVCGPCQVNGICKSCMKGKSV